jgi:serine/threonine protein kinase
VADLTGTTSHGVEATGAQPAAPSGPPAVAGARVSSVANTEVLQSIGDYTVVKKIGEGGMGAVYLAEDTKLHRKAAIKTMKPALATNQAARERFLREARAAAAVEHDNIVPILHIGETADGAPYIAMPFLQGEPLDARLKREPVASTGLILKVACEVANGLAAAHAKRLVHRDIKPANIWLEGDPSATAPIDQVRRCKILDFGLVHTADSADVEITKRGHTPGTPAYMSPEQSRREKLDHRSDLFSLGVTLYQIATGRLPFQCPNLMALVFALATETPPSAFSLNPNLPPALSNLIDRLLRKDPAGRPQSAAEVSATIRQILKDLQAKKASPSALLSGSQAVAVYTLPAPALNPWEDMTEVGAEEPVAKAPEPAKQRNRAPWYIAGGILGVLLLGAALAVVIIRVQTAEGTLVVEINDPDVETRIKNGKLVLIGPDGKERYTISSVDRNKKIDAGAYTIRVEGADGLVLDTNEFTLNKNGQVTVRVTLDPTVVAKKSDPPKKDLPKFDDRKAAEWVLSVGGWVEVNGRKVTAMKDLPDGSLTLRDVALGLGNQFSDSELVNLKACKNLEHLHLGFTGVGDAGLAHLKGCTALVGLNLVNTRIKEEGLADFLKDKTKLGEVWLSGMQVGDAVLVNFKNCKQLGLLDLGGTQVSDTGLAYLKDCQNLRTLNIAKTKVTAKGVTELAKSLPQCQITWDGDTIEPTVNLEADRKAAEWVLSIGGVVRVNGELYPDLRDAKDLPKGPFRLTGVLLEDKHIKDSDLTILKDYNKLEVLNLCRTAVTDAGMANFRNCPNLRQLFLDNTTVGDAGLENFKNCKNLTTLGVGTATTDVGLAHFQHLKGLQELGLIGSKVTNAGLTLLKDHRGLVILWLPDTKTDDAGLAHLRDCKTFQRINLSNTGASDIGLNYFKGCKDLAEVWVTGTSIGDEGVSFLKDCKSLVSLRLQ